MAMKNIFRFVPWVVVGQVIGATLIIPLMYYLINKFYYPHKYNNDADLYYKCYIEDSYNIKIKMPEDGSKYYLENIDEDTRSGETFEVKADGNYFKNPEAWYNIFYSLEYKKFFNTMYFTDIRSMTWNHGKDVVFTVNRDDMNNPEYGTKENPVPVLKVVGVHESIRDNNKDYDKAYMDSFYRNNVIRYLKYKMPKEEFERRFKHKE